MIFFYIFVFFIYSLYNMSIYIHSEEQNKILESPSSLSNIAYNDETTALHSVAYQALQNWIKGSATTIIIPNTNDLKKLQAIIKDMKMDELSAAIELNSTFNEKDLSKLHDLIKDDSKIRYQKLDDADFHFQNIHKKATDFYSQKYLPSSNGKSWRETLDLFLALKPNHHTNILFRSLNAQLFDFTFTEMKTIRASISEALTLYIREHEISEAEKMENLLHKNAQKPDILQDIAYHLFTLKEVASILRDRFYDYYLLLENNYIYSISHDIEELQKEIHLLTHKIQHYYNVNDTKASILAIFSEEQKLKDETLKTLTKEWNELFAKIAKWQVTKQVICKSIPNNAIELLNQTNDKLHEIKEKKVSQKKDFLKSVNRFNLNDNTLTDLEYDLGALTHRINESEILFHTLEVNTLSFDKQIDFITDLVYQLEVILIKIEKNNQYYQWKSFINLCSQQVKAVIKQLRLFDPSDWLHAFDTWYHLSMLTKENNHISSSKEINFQSLIQFYDAQMTNKIELKSVSDKAVLKVNFENLKKSNEALYSSIKKNKKLSHPILWKYLLGDNFEFFNKVYPIILTDDDALDHIKTQQNNHLIIFNKSDINPEILQLFASVTVYHAKEDFKGTYDFAITQHQLPTDIKLQDVTISERLPLVRSLTDILIAMGMMPEIFQMRNASIISFATPFINQYFTENLYSHGLKKIYADGSIHETMLGALLDSENKIYILIEDGLFNHKNLEFICFQSLCLNKIKKIGCEILDIDTQALITNIDAVLRPMIDLIKSSQKQSKPSDQKQFSFEFN